MPAERGDVIVAPATPPGAAERAVVRLSGVDLLARADALLPRTCPRPGGGRAVLRGQLEWLPGSRVEVAVQVFPGPHSATGEDVVELHLPGSEPVVAAVLRGLLERGARLAEPGEFTRRAFLRGALDLVQAEAVLSLVSARSAAAAESAAALLGGALGGELQHTRDALSDALVELEAGLDFEEGDSQDLAPNAIGPLLQSARDALARAAAGEQARRPERSGPPRIGLFGPANAGKTTLYTRLTGDAGLVSAIRGTTRDWREAEWRAGADDTWLLLDGPGLGGAATDPRDAAARAQAAANLPGVDLWLRCEDPGAPAGPDLQPPLAGPWIQVWTHADRGVLPPPSAPGASATLTVATTEDQGLEALTAACRAAIEEGASAREQRRQVGERHAEALATATAAVQRAQQLDAGGGAQDLVAEELRSALHALAGLVGAWTPEDTLDRLFARFCVGK